MARACLSLVLLVSVRPSVAFGEWRRGTRANFLSSLEWAWVRGAGGRVWAAGCRIPLRCCPSVSRLPTPHPSASLFGGPRQARAREWPFSGLPRRARAGKRPETEQNPWGGAGRDGLGGGGAQTSPCAPPCTVFEGTEDRSDGQGHCGVSGCPLPRDAPLLLFSPTSSPQDELVSFL